MIGAPVVSDSHSCWIAASSPDSVMRRDRVVDAPGEGAVLVEHEAELVGGATGLGGELADDDAALDLDARHEQRRRQVEHGGVDLVRLERGLGADVVVVDERRPASGWMTSVMKSRLVVPAWAPNLTSFRSATVVAPSAGEPSRATMAWLLV